MAEIDPRDFKPAPNPFPPGSTAWHLFGSARDQWRWWYQRERCRKYARPFVTYPASLGVLWGMTFLDAQ